MKRLTLICAVAGLLSVEGALGQVRQGGQGLLPAMRDTPVRSASKDTAIRSLLLKEVEGVRWEETALRDVIDWLQGEGGVNIVVRWKALAASSVDEETWVTLEMHDTTVADILNEVLDQVSDPIDPLTYMGVGKTLRISTRSDFDRQLYTRVYNITDLLMRIRSNRGAPRIDLENSAQQSGGGGGGQGGSTQVESIFGQGGGSGGGNDDDDDRDDEDDDERAQDIIDIIKKTVEPQTWDEDGGPGTLEAFNNNLIVRNTLRVHEILGGPFYMDE